MQASIYSRCLAVLLGLLTAASCAQHAPQLAGFSAVGASASECRVWRDADLSRSSIDARHREIRLQLRGPAAILQHEVDGKTLYAELRWRDGGWLGTYAVTHTAAVGLADACDYELSVILSKEPQNVINEAAFRADLDAGFELQVRLVVGVGDCIAARSAWVGFAQNQAALRRSLSQLRR